MATYARNLARQGRALAEIITRGCICGLELGLLRPSNTLPYEDIGRSTVIVAIGSDYRCVTGRGHARAEIITLIRCARRSSTCARITVARRGPIGNTANGLHAIAACPYAVQRACTRCRKTGACLQVLELVLQYGSHWRVARSAR